MYKLHGIFRKRVWGFNVKLKDFVFEPIEWSKKASYIWSLDKERSELSCFHTIVLSYSHYLTLACPSFLPFSFGSHFHLSITENIFGSAAFVSILRFFPNFPPSLPLALSYSQDIKVIQAKDLIKASLSQNTSLSVQFCFWFILILFSFLFMAWFFSPLSMFQSFPGLQFVFLC